MTNFFNIVYYFIIYTYFYVWSRGCYFLLFTPELNELSLVLITKELLSMYAVISFIMVFNKSILAYFSKSNIRLILDFIFTKIELDFIKNRVKVYFLIYFSIFFMYEQFPVLMDSSFSLKIFGHYIVFDCCLDHIPDLELWFESTKYSKSIYSKQYFEFFLALFKLYGYLELLINAYINFIGFLLQFMFGLFNVNFSTLFLVTRGILVYEAESDPYHVNFLHDFFLGFWAYLLFLIFFYFF